MAGSNPAFNPDVFRQSIRDTMNMGLPTALVERPTFRWSIVRDYAIDDPAQNPYDWTATPTSVTEHADVQVPVAVEFAARNSATNPLAQFDSSKAIITILDEDYDLVRGADQVILGGNTYVIDYVGPPLGLFEVTVYQVYASALDES